MFFFGGSGNTHRIKQHKREQNVSFFVFHVLFYFGSQGAAFYFYSIEQNRIKEPALVAEELPVLVKVIHTKS